MQKPGSEIDGARVIQYGALRPDSVHYINELGKRIALPYFAITQYPEGSVYVFYCDTDWKVWSDFDYSDIDEAIAYIATLQPLTVFTDSHSVPDTPEEGIG